MTEGFASINNDEWFASLLQMKRSSHPGGTNQALIGSDETMIGFISETK